MAYTAADVKKLREKTDAPMMECKSALEEADGDMERAEQILREKGKAAAQKRVGRTTSAGVVAFAASPDGKTVGGVVVESETDFVARNEDFIAIVQSIAELVRDGESSDGGTNTVPSSSLASSSSPPPPPLLPCAASAPPSSDAIDC